LPIKPRTKGKDHRIKCGGEKKAVKATWEGGLPGGVPSGDAAPSGEWVSRSGEKGEKMSQLFGKGSSSVNKEEKRRQHLTEGVLRGTIRREGLNPEGGGRATWPMIQ